VAGRWSKISAISALAVSPKRRKIALYARFHADKNIGSRETAAFLRQLARHLQGHVAVLWDSGPQHKGSAVRDFLARHRRFHVHRFPGYAPELNPDEFVWNHLQRDVSNGVPDDLAHLKRLLQSPLARLRRSQELLWSCIHASELPWK